MANTRLVIAAALAGIALALALFGMIGNTLIMQAGHASLAASHFAGLSGSHVPGLITLALSVAGFAVSWGQKSYLLAGLLIAAGTLYTIHLAPFLDHSVIAFPGPIVGLLFGHVILALGAAKAVGNLPMLVQSSNK